MLQSLFIIGFLAGLPAETQGSPQQKENNKQGSGQSPAGSVPGDSGKNDPNLHQDLLFLASDRPAIIRFQLTIDGTPYREAQKNFAGRLFRRLDLNNDDVLSTEEAWNIPTRAELGADLPSGEPPLSPVTPDELEYYLIGVMGEPCILKPAPLQSIQAIPLFNRVDRDQNGRLSNSELLDGPLFLNKLDLNDDGTYSAIELLPARMLMGISMPVLTDRTALENDLPFLLLPPERYLRSAAARIETRYQDSKTGVIPASILDSKFDNGDGKLSTGEILEWLTRSQPETVLGVNFVHRKPGRTQLELLNPTLPRPRTDARKQVLNVASIPLEFVIEAQRGVVTHSVAFYKQKLRQADADKDQSLTIDEFPALEMLNVPFNRVDRDRDQKITGDEVGEYIDLITDLTRSRITLTISTERTSLFELLDRDTDFRLSPREFLYAEENLVKLDQNGDGEFDTAEISGRFTLAVSLAVPPLFERRAQMDPMMSRMRISQPELSNGDQPLWFLRMDRNRDGDITPREFLGDEKLFKKLDANGDSLLSVQEIPSEQKED